MAALSAVSCSKELQEGTVPSDGNGAGKIELRIPADEATKTVFGDGYEVKWNDDDKIGIFVGTSANVEASLTRGADGKAYFTATVDPYEAGTELYAYYPYNANAGTAPAKVTLKIPYQQKQSELSVFNGSYNPMVAVPVTLPAAGEALEQPLKFRHMGSILEFDITNVPAGETLKSVQFIVDEHSSVDKFPAADDMSYDLNKTEEDLKVGIIVPKGTYYKSVTVALEKSETASKVYMTLVPGKYTGNIYISTDKSLYRFSGKTIEAKRAEVKTIKADLSSGRADNSKEIKSALDYEAFANAANAGDYSAWVDSDGEVKLGAGITSATYFTRILKDWNGKFNGQNHTIIQRETSVPLFTVIGKDGVVENLVLEGELKKASYPSGPSTAAVAQYNRGTIRNVVNAIEINLTDVDEPYMIGGMVIMNGGLIENCVQKGDINVSYNLTAIRVSYIGGIACFAADAAEYAKEGVEVNVGTFRNCTNSGKITVNKAGAAKAYLNKFAIGGICAIVQNGTPATYPLFEGCRNEGDIVRRDDSNGLNSCSAMGGIVGRAANYFQLKTGGAFDVDNYQVYLKISDCHNTGNIECSAFLTNGWASGSSTSGARMGATGGIIGYANGFADSPALITGCTSRCTVSGGHVNQTVVMGGIAGMTSGTEISNCSAETLFSDSSLQIDELKVATVGGVIGYVRHNSSVTGGQYSAQIAMPKTAVADAGMLAGGCYIGKTPQTLSASGVKLCGSISHKGLETPVTVTSENIASNLVSFGECASENVSLWVK